MRVPPLLRTLSGVLWALLVAALFIGGAQPEAAGVFESHWDKVAHFGYFAMLAGLFLVAAGLRHPLVALLVAIAIGIADELAQTRLPGRYPSVPDLAFDAAGAAMAVVLIALVQRRFAARRSA